MKQLKPFLAALKAVKEDFEENKEFVQAGEASQFIYPLEGICGALERALGGHRPRLSTLRPHFETWPHYSGVPIYPVGNGYLDYSVHDNLWTGDIGELRLNLLDHMISEVEKESLNQTTKEGCIE